MLVIADCRFFVTKFNHFFCLIFKQRTKDITTNGYKKRVKKKKKTNLTTKVWVVCLILKQRTIEITTSGYKKGKK